MYEQASQAALDVINNHPYGLWEDFSDNFRIPNRGGKESIFSVGFGTGGGAISFWEVGQFNVRLLPSRLSSEAGITNAQGWQYATNDLYETFADTDERKEATFLTQFVANDGSNVILDRVWIDKYWDRTAEPNGGDSNQDFPVIRYADVLLVYAEAQARLGNFGVANDYLNMVRERAGLGEISATNMEDFIDLILEERGREFVAEGQRWFDLTRLGRLEEAVMEAKGVSVSSHHYLFPIPQRERDVNPNLPQNDGY
ncbi:RagB/SusD family nutrient uptake outer membrane protein [Antarcticibacterium sp. 1MA-6-2]|uniref:RagB/SusD family nutrient uptake outer membrane protein n=1 Tax=Antarcticibacterium sp. 1MA-6-2 TaxID=2908210 RepID=UPI001F1EF874|nr:RagB/SusD family nutrient uptake outer membrane protein [Antarcticibacterium sp. 1MA-6-2]UJH90624.1 RagB/SusD family nutrient uptake outer membrane protein [Antarcticibacterium sp. 1MA-6-2]